MCETKICTKCKQEKLLECFGKCTRNKDGKQTRCKECLNQQAIIDKQKRKPKIKPENGFKVCAKCSIEKHVDEFYLNSNLFMGVHSECKTCSVNKVQDWYKNNTDKVKNRERKKKIPKIKEPKLELTEKICSYCNLLKPISVFGKNTSRCNSCLKEYTKIRSCTVEVTEKVCGRCKQIKPSSSYNKDNNTVHGLSSRCDTCRKDEYERRKEKMMLNNKIRHKEKSKNDPFYRLITSIRGRIKNSLFIYLKDNAKKSKGSEEILGCSWKEFKIHIESQFLPWMTWNNFGDACGDSPEYDCSWDLDHIIPITWAKTNNEVYMLNHWSNFQPLCSKINRWEKKGNIVPLCNIELNLTVYN